MVFRAPAITAGSNIREQRQCPGDIESRAARIYSPTLGVVACNHPPDDRVSSVLQTDPIGYGDGMNMYRYVGNDPVNAVDPTGLFCSITNNTRSVTTVVNGNASTSQVSDGVSISGCGGSRGGAFDGGVSLFGDGPGGGGGGNEEEGEAKSCRTLRENAEAGRARLRWFFNDNWNDVELLTAYRDENQRNAEGLDFLDNRLVDFLVGAATTGAGATAGRHRYITGIARGGAVSLASI